MQPSVRAWCSRYATSDPVVALDIGGRNINGSIHDLWRRAEWVTIDITDGPGVSIVADAADWMPDREYDVVVCTETFEHCERWQDLVATAYAALREGGRFIATCAGPGWAKHSGIDGLALRDGEHYCNVSAAELGEQMRNVGFRDVVANQAGINTEATGVR